MKSLFISYKYEDKSFADKIQRWAQEGRLGVNVTTIREESDFRQMGEKGIRDHLRPKLKGCAALLLLVGQDTHNSQGVGYEIEVARTLNKKIIAIRIPGTTGAIPKKANVITEVTFEPEAVRRAIES